MNAQALATRRPHFPDFVVMPASRVGFSAFLFGFGAQGLISNGGSNVSGKGPQNKGCMAAGSNNFSTAVDRVGDVHGSIYSGGAAALKSGGQAESAAALASASIPAWGRAGAIHGAGFAGGLFGSFILGELVDPLGGGIVGAVVAGVVGSYARSKGGEAAGGAVASAVGQCI